ncbi:MAG: NYN domain-containing protein [Nitrospirota bacterium]|nr:NYN domain-containing protein [Nitrospirota bacterium]
MATHVIVDGYNLLGARGQVGRTGATNGEAAREQLLRDLSAYRQRKGHPITVVFDGWQQGGGAECQEHRAGLLVVYSRRGERADQVIQRLAEEYGRDCAVVSSDREVTDFARARGAFVIGAAEFESRLKERPVAVARGGPFRKDEPEGDLPRRNPEKKGNPRKLPKALRKRSRQLRGF